MNQRSMQKKKMKTGDNLLTITNQNTKKFVKHSDKNGKWKHWGISLDFRGIGRKEGKALCLCVIYAVFLDAASKMLLLLRAISFT